MVVQAADHSGKLLASQRNLNELDSIPVNNVWLLAPNKTFASKQTRLAAVLGSSGVLDSLLVWTCYAVLLTEYNRVL